MFKTKEGARKRKDADKTEDENYEILLFLRLFIKDAIRADQDLASLCKVAYNSALRAYSGH